MAKDRKVYVCENCGQESLRWVGRCPSCQQWNTMKELVIREEKPMAGAARAALKAAGHDSAQKARPVPVAEIRADEEPRMDMGDRELNRVLGGGLVLVENLRLSPLAEADAVRFFAFPLPYVNADGAPVRAVAEFTPKERDIP